MSIIPDRFYCPIYYEVMTHAVQLPCAHNFQKEAIFKWLEMKGNCPTCRFEVKWYHWVGNNEELQDEIVQFYDDHPEMEKPKGLERTHWLMDAINNLKDRTILMVNSVPHTVQRRGPPIFYDCPYDIHVVDHYRAAFDAGYYT